MRPPAPRTPPVTVLHRVRDALGTAGVDCVVGGSAVLAAHGLVAEVRDWDVVTDAHPDAVAAALAALGVAVERAAPHPRFASDALLRLVVDGTEVDVLVGFRPIAADGTVVPVPARAVGAWHGVPLARTDDWARAYRAMDRPDRAALLEGVRGTPTGPTD